jgi:hypothetical protein
MQGSQIYMGQFSRTATGKPIWRSSLFRAQPDSSSGTFNEVRGGSSFLVDNTTPLSFSNPVALVLDQYGVSSARLALPSGPLNIKRFNAF